MGGWEAHITEPQTDQDGGLQGAEFCQQPRAQRKTVTRGETLTEVPAPDPQKPGDYKCTLLYASKLVTISCAALERNRIVFRNLFYKLRNWCRVVMSEIHDAQSQQKRQCCSNGFYGSLFTCLSDILTIVVSHSPVCSSLWSQCQYRLSLTLFYFSLDVTFTVEKFSQSLFSKMRPYL